MSGDELSMQETRRAYLRDYVLYGSEFSYNSYVILCKVAENEPVERVVNRVLLDSIEAMSNLSADDGK